MIARVRGVSLWLIAIGFLAIVLTAGWGGETCELFVFNRPFPGKVWLERSAVYAEAAPLLKLLNVTAASQTDNKMVLLHNHKEIAVPLIRKEGRVYLPMKEIASALGFKFQYNGETRIADLLRGRLPAQDASQHPPGRRSTDKYQVDMSDTKVLTGIDEMVVQVTLVNRGEDRVPGVRITCEITDDLNRPVDSQTKTFGNFLPGKSLTVFFKTVYPKASGMGGYREYNTKLRHNLSLSYSDQLLPDVGIESPESDSVGGNPSQSGSSLRDRIRGGDRRR